MNDLVVSLVRKHFETQVNSGDQNKQKCNDQELIQSNPTAHPQTKKERTHTEIDKLSRKACTVN